MNRPVKTALEGMPFLLMAGLGGGLLILTVYSLAVTSVVDHLKGRAFLNGRRAVKALLDGQAEKEGGYANEQPD